MIFKKGDMVLAIDFIHDDIEIFIKKGSIYEVESQAGNGGNSWVNIVGIEGHHSGGRFSSRCFKLLPINNKLNQKLYPSYKENNGFLVPDGPEKSAENEQEL